ncbi:hypothetical protein OH76DRAFT_1504468 [Lentinus brumalis]|uniref:CxC6 like cysteine cluster associated with KDZ domain-containing protein n=1 Tax=Lentinus brumalis TaxID=2498619 RepID=A0A371CKQ5_9APHY|nr:hypothetical protein OH76DRAFT_1504468 [Polyporus brumalis]
MAGRRLTTTADDIDKSLSKAASSFDLGAKPDCVASRRIGSPLLSGVGAEVIVPPVRSCITPDCPQQGKPLGGHKHHYAATLYTRSRGTLPVRVYSLYCKGTCCHTTYRHDYLVRSARSPDAVREYYPGVPHALEASEYSFVESKLVQVFRSQMALCHASGEIVAKCYNLGLCDLPDARQLSGDTVWHAFYLHALLLDSTRRSDPLRVPHSGVHAERLQRALEARNLRMAGVGQPEWAHACDLCEKIYPTDPSDPEKRLSACVMDGVTVGHPRCNENLCTNRLRSPRDRFCPEHAAEEEICAVHGCALRAEDSKRTCRTPAHRQHEEDKREKGKAFFRLKKRADDKLQGIKASLGRRWTHNEQLMFRPCGVILSRCTFYESESVGNALRFILATFPEHLPRAMPSYIFFDNNCLLLKHILASKEHRLDDIGLPVDVFHAIRKHKESDAFCAMNCNPACFTELYSDGLGWLFNSSAAEQGNVWFGKFMAVAREMSEIHYNFFLDEMILIHNEQRVEVLRKRGCHPRTVPLDELAMPRH